MRLSTLLINCLAVGIGGALGTLFRYGLNVYTLSSEYPLGTLLENGIGSFLLGMLTGWCLHRKVAEWLRVGLGVGVCGGFTTMSTFAADTFFLAEFASAPMALLYVLLSLFGGVILAMLGMVYGERKEPAKQEKNGGTS